MIGDWLNVEISNWIFVLTMIMWICGVMGQVYGKWMVAIQFSVLYIILDFAAYLVLSKVIGE